MVVYGGALGTGYKILDRVSRGFSVESGEAFVTLLGLCTTTTGVAFATSPVAPLWGLHPGQWSSLE